MFWELLYKLKSVICRHEYVFYPAPSYLDVNGYYACRKCGKFSINPSKKLIIKDKQ